MSDDLTYERPRELPARSFGMVSAIAKVPEDALATMSADEFQRYVVRDSMGSKRGSSLSLRLRSGREYRKLSNSLAPNSGDRGGYAVGGTDLIDNIELALLDTSGVRQAADVIRRETAIETAYPTLNDTENEGVIVQPGAAAQEVDFEFGKTSLFDRKFTTGVIKAPYELVRDAPILSRDMGRLLGARIGRIQNRKFTLGTGSGEPTGVLTGAYVGATASEATAIAMDDLFSLVGSVNPEHRSKASWMMHSDIYSYLRRQKDASSRYLWPASGLDEWPVVFNHHMPSTIVSGARTILFGNFHQYKIRDVGEIRIIIYREQFVAPNDQIGFQAFMTSDGAIVDPGQNAIAALLQP